jgi:branched-chain amino acid transport system substrate-binding protein
MAVQEAAAAVGVMLKVSKQVSITAPSYTSQCLQLQQQGVRTVILTLDAASMGRLANSCRALVPPYRPAYVALPLGVGNEQQFFGAGPSLGGTYVPTTAFPWSSDATPAPAAFQRAKATFGFSGASGYAASLGWTAGALTTAVSGHLSATNPTTAQLLQGLHEVRGNRLGGLTGPLSFTAVVSGGHKIPYCWSGVTSNAANTGWGTPATQACAAGRLPSDPND